jgi:hypothetical protein
MGNFLRAAPKAEGPAMRAAVPTVATPMNWRLVNGIIFYSLG